MLTILATTMIALAAPQDAPAASAPSARPCPARDVGLPAELAGWATTGTGVGFDRSFQLAATGGAASAAFTITRAGRYRIALDQPGWIDVLHEGHAIGSVAHGHGPDCSTIRKLVGFDLVPGQYTLRLTKLGGDKARAMIVSPAQAGGG